jgi:hypothetical protein
LRHLAFLICIFEAEAEVRVIMLSEVQEDSSRFKDWERVAAVVDYGGDAAVGVGL